MRFAGYGSQPAGVLHWKQKISLRTDAFGTTWPE
jgi:hypothetical protein